MKFRAEYIEMFKGIFFESQPYILAMEGCQDVKLLQDNNDPTIMFTHSLWDNQEALDNYRATEFFGKTWKKTKALFDAKPVAWSLNTVETKKLE